MCARVLTSTVRTCVLAHVMFIAWLRVGGENQAGRGQGRSNSSLRCLQHISMEGCMLSTADS